jgi:hypothetical protein
MPHDTTQYARLLEHQRRCREITKRAYYQRLAEVVAPDPYLVKAAFGGLDPTREFQPGRAGMGGLMGAGAGALGALGHGLYGGKPIDPALMAKLMAGGGALGGALGGFTVPEDEAMQRQMMANQLAAERQQILASLDEQMGMQDANASL